MSDNETVDQIIGKAHAENEGFFLNNYRKISDLCKMIENLKSNKEKADFYHLDNIEAYQAYYYEQLALITSKDNPLHKNAIQELSLLNKDYAKFKLKEASDLAQHYFNNWKMMVITPQNDNPAAREYIFDCIQNITGKLSSQNIAMIEKDRGGPISIALPPFEAANALSILENAAIVQEELAEITGDKGFLNLPKEETPLSLLQEQKIEQMKVNARDLIMNVPKEVNELKAELQSATKMRNNAVKDEDKYIIDHWYYTALVNHYIKAPHYRLDVVATIFTLTDNPECRHAFKSIINDLHFQMLEDREETKKEINVSEDANTVDVTQLPEFHAARNDLHLEGLTELRDIIKDMTVDASIEIPTKYKRKKRSALNGQVVN